MLKKRAVLSERARLFEASSRKTSVAFFRSEFLSRPEAERQALMHRIGVMAEIFEERLLSVESMISELERLNKPASRIVESSLLSRLARVERTSRNLLLQVGRVFVSSEAAREFASYDSAYPLNKVHSLLLKSPVKFQAGISFASRFYDLRQKIDILKSQGLLSASFKPPWQP